MAEPPPEVKDGSSVAPFSLAPYFPRVGARRRPLARDAPLGRRPATLGLLRRRAHPAPHLRRAGPRLPRRRRPGGRRTPPPLPLPGRRPRPRTPAPGRRIRRPHPGRRPALANTTLATDLRRLHAPDRAGASSARHPQQGRVVQLRREFGIRAQGLRPCPATTALAKAARVGSYCNASTSSATTSGTSATRKRREGTGPAPRCGQSGSFCPRPAADFPVGCSRERTPG